MCKFCIAKRGCCHSPEPKISLNLRFMPELDLAQKLEARDSNSNVERYIYTKALNKTSQAGKPEYSRERSHSFKNPFELTKMSNSKLAIARCNLPELDSHLSEPQLRTKKE